jgi:hypothetical protein
MTKKPQAKKNTPRSNKICLDQDVVQQLRGSARAGELALRCPISTSTW